MKTDVVLNLRADDMLCQLPQGQELIEFMSRAAPQTLRDAENTSDFIERLKDQVAPYHCLIGDLNVDLVDPTGAPADLDHDECVFVCVSVKERLH